MLVIKGCLFDKNGCFSLLMTASCSMREIKSTKSLQWNASRSILGVLKDLYTTSIQSVREVRITSQLEAVNLHMMLQSPYELYHFQIVSVSTQMPSGEHCCCHLGLMLLEACNIMSGHQFMHFPCTLMAKRNTWVKINVFCFCHQLIEFSW